MPTPGATPSTSPEASTCVIDSGYLDYVNKSKLTLDTIYNKTAAITDISAPGMAELLKSYSDLVEQESTNVRNTTAKFDAIYKGKGLEKCTSYQNFWDTANSVQTQAASVKAFIDANYVKAKWQAERAPPIKSKRIIAMILVIKFLRQLKIVMLSSQNIMRSSKVHLT